MAEAWVFAGSDDKPRGNILRLDLQKSAWRTLQLAEDGIELSAPAARDFHDSALDPSTMTMYIFGGNCAAARLNDLWAIRLKD